MSVVPPFGTSFLAAEWPLLLESCSAVPDDHHFRQQLRGSIKWRALFSLAEEHGVVAQLDSRLRGLQWTQIPEDISKSLRERHRAQLFFTLSMTAEMFRVLALFKAAGVGVLVVKGPVLSMRAYGDPGLRQYVDLDFLVRDRDLLKATQLLSANGYEGDVPVAAIEAGKIPGEYLFTKTGTRILIELHTEHTFRYFPKPLPMEEYFHRSTSVELDGNHVPALSSEDEFVLICIHGAKHFWERLMWIADVAAMMSTNVRLDWAAVTKSAQAVGAQRMVSVAMTLAQNLLGAKIPAEMRGGATSDPAARTICERIQGWLPYAGYAPPPLPQRARFRADMRGGGFAGWAYLLRLSLSPTEEDWVTGDEAKRPWVLDALQRPLRLIKKYGRDGE